MFKNVKFVGEADFNLKYTDYSDITFENCSVTATGIEYQTGLGGNGLLIKGRNDGSSYSPQPAALNGVTIKGGTYTAPAGFYAIGIGNNVTGISFLKDGTQNVKVTGAGTGLALYTDAAAGPLNNISFGSALDYFIKLGSAANVDVTGAAMNFGGLTNPTAIEEKMYHKIDLAPLGYITWNASQTQANLSDITLSKGSLDPAFDAAVTDYTVNLDYNTGSTTVSAELASNLSVLTVDGVIGSDKTVTLAKGASQTVVFTVTAQNGATKSYNVIINRAKDGDTNLASLTASKGTLSPAFSASAASYTLALDKNTDSVTLEATLAVATSTLSIDGTAGLSKTFTLDNGASKTVEFKVTADDGAVKTYTVVITRALKDSETSLKSLVPSVGKLSPAFDAATTSYTLSLDKISDSVTIAAAPAVGTSNVTINGEAVTQKTITVANNASQTVVIKVTSESGATRDYTVVVQRGDYGTFKLTVKDGSGNAVPGAVVGVYYDAAATSLYKQGTADANGLATISGLDPKTYYVKFISVPSGYQLSATVFSLAAEDNTVTERSIVIIKSGEQGYVYTSLQLKAIKVSTGTLSPKFDPEKRIYTLKLSEKTSKVTITPSKADSASKLYINGKIAKSITLTLTNGQSKKVTLKVVSGKKSLTYTMTVSRAKSTNASLKSLAVSRGKLTPKFAAGTISYTLALTATQTGVRFSRCWQAASRNTRLR